MEKNIGQLARKFFLCSYSPAGQEAQLPDALTLVQESFLGSGREDALSSREQRALLMFLLSHILLERRLQT